MAKVKTKDPQGDDDRGDRPVREAAPVPLVPLDVLEERRRANGIVGIVIDSALSVVQADDSPAARALAKLFTEAQGAIRAGTSVSDFAFAHMPPAPK